MSGQQTIEVTVSSSGHISVEAKGYVGRSCEEATKFLERTLGTATNTSRTAAYYAGETEPQRETEQS